MPLYSSSGGGGTGATDGPSFRATHDGMDGVSPFAVAAFGQRITGWTEVSDSAGCFSSSRFTPNVAGFYAFSVYTKLVDESTLTYASARILKNGTGPDTWEITSQTGDASRLKVINGVTVAYANGSTDYFDLYVDTDASNTLENVTHRWEAVYLGP